jgi:aspartate/methionine/tyrosine aminotransferase
MKVKIHKLFEFLLETTAAEPEAVLGFSLATSPRLGDFLNELDPDLSLDWSNQSFQGLPILRQHVVGRTGVAHVCGEDDVLITAGAAEANFLAIAQLVQPGDELIVESPGWPQPTVLGQAIGAEIKVLPRREQDGWRFDLDDLAGLISKRTRLIFLSNPNNPTGQVLGESELNEIVSLADRVGAYLLCDEVYAGLEWEGPRVPSVAGLYERGISTGGVSKALGLQGLRTGWMLCRHRQVIFDALVLRENTSEIMNVLGEMIAEIALRPQRYESALAESRAEGLQNLELLDAFIDARDELSWQRPPAGLIGLCRLNLPIDGEELARRLLQPPYRTFLIPGIAYGYPNHIRLGVGGGQAAGLEIGLARLADFLEATPL